MIPQRQIDANQLAALLGVLPDVVVLVDMDRKIQFINRAVEGYTLPEILGTDLLDFVDPEFWESQAAMFDRVRETGEPESDEIVLTDARGAEQWHEGMMIPLTTDGTMDGVAIVTRNITERRRAEKEAERLRGLVPVCSWCKKVRDDEGYWQEVESYVEESTGSRVTHSMCPECEETVLGEDRGSDGSPDGPTLRSPPSTDPDA